MTASMIDLPKHLQPTFFLQRAEDGLTGRALAVVSFCKGIWRDGRWEAVEEASQEAEGLWRKYGEQTGHAIAFLWLADLYWRNGKLENATRLCVKAMEHIPSGPAPVYRIAKAVAHYMCGLSHQMLGETSAAFTSYQEAFELFQAAQRYWNRTGDSNQTETYEDVLEWVRELVGYVSDIRLNPPAGTDSPLMLVCPWRTGVEKSRYLLAELPLTKPVNAQEIKPKATQDFVRDRRQSWSCCGGVAVDGYKVGSSVRVLDLAEGIRNYRLSVLNPVAQYGRSHLALPTGAPYYSFQVDDSVELDGRHIKQGDYLLVWSRATPAPDWITLPQLKPDGDVRAFKRDSEGHVHFVDAKPEPVTLGDEKSGSADFDLRPV